MSILTNLFSGGAGKLADGIGNILDKVITTNKERMSLDNEMKKAEQQYLLENRKLDVQERQLEVDDTKSARDTASAIQTSANSTLLSKNTGPYLALGTVALTFILFFVMLFMHPDQGTKEVILYILGVLSAIVTQIFSFYFGSSQGSHAKQDVLNQLNAKR